MKRKFTAARQAERCNAVVKLADGSTADCMRRAIKNGHCHQHDKISMQRKEMAVQSCA